MDTLGISFDQARAFVQARKSLSYSDAQEGVSKARAFVQIHLAYKQLFPDGSKVPKLPKSLAEARTWEEVEVLNKTYDALNALFPIDETWIMESESDYIMIEPQSPHMSWDEFEEMRESPQDWVNDDMDFAFPVMIWSIGNCINKETWDSLSEQLGWDVKWPKKIIQTDVPFDVELLEKNLDAAGLHPFLMAINVAWHNTGNYFFDYDPSDEGEFEHSAFTAESIVDLAGQWEDAAPIIQEWHEAIRMWHEGSGVLQKVVNIMAKSLDKSHAGKESKTLMELFEEEDRRVDELP